MTLNNPEQIKTWLWSRNIHVPDDWLEACLDWIHEENQGIELTLNQLKDAVFEQWLLADLHEIQCPCLPPQVATEKKYQLTGAYSLQIDSLVDVSKPYYGQLLKVKGAENENVSVTAEPPAPWEPKPSRMLMMKLTDGVTHVQGMEYRQIPCLKDTIKPGAKIVIQGSILCRNSVLMLKDENVKILGGEVDTLVEANTAQAVLQSALEKSMEHSGQEFRQEFEGGPVCNVKKPQVKQETHEAKQGFSSQNNNQKFNRNMKKEMKTENMHQITQNCDVKQEIEFEDDLAFEDFLDDMEEFQNVPPPPEESVSHRASPQQRKVTLTRNYIGNATVKSTINELSNQPICVDNKKYARHQNTEPLIGANYSRQLKTQNLKSASSSPPYHSSLSIEHSSGREISSTGIPIRPGAVHTIARNSNYLSKDPLTGSTVKNMEEDCVFEGDFDEDLDDFDFTSITTNSMTKTDNQICTKDSSEKKPPLVKSEVIDNSDSFDRNGITTSVGAKNSSISAGKKSLSSNLKPSISMQSLTSDNFFKNQILNQRDRKRKRSEVNPIDQFTTIKIPPHLPVLNIDEMPFTYLSIVKTYLPAQKPMTFRVKAFISTLLDKLDYCKGTRWKLSCKINDGSDTLDVALSNGVLTQLIGFSAPDSLEMRKRAATDPSVREILAEGVQQCQQKLIELLCVMKIHVDVGQRKPEIASISMLSHSDIDLLQNRVIQAIEKLS